MNNYEALKAYAAQLLEDKSEARRIVEEVISDAIGLRIGADKTRAFVFASIRNKCEDHNRLMSCPEFQAAALGVSVGNVQQSIRAIREWRWMDS